MSGKATAAVQEHEQARASNHNDFPATSVQARWDVTMTDPDAVVIAACVPVAVTPTLVPCSLRATAGVEQPGAFASAMRRWRSSQESRDASRVRLKYLFDRTAANVLEPFAPNGIAN